MHTDGGNVFEIFLHLSVLKNQILVILPHNAISLGIYHEISSNSLNVWGMSYKSYIKRVLSCDFQITPANGNIDFERKLLLQFTSIFSCTIDTNATYS